MLSSATSTCPCCHQTIVDSSLITSHLHHSPAEEINHLQAEARRIEDIIRKFNGQRAGVLRRLNTVQSTTRLLSPELLSLIFQHATPTLDHFLVELGEIKEKEKRPAIRQVFASVSHYWRQVVFSTPGLWDTISAERIKAGDVGKWDFLKASFEKSGGLPLNISFWGWKPRFLPSRHLMSPVIDNTLLQHTSRVRSLSLKDFAPHALAWLKAIPEFTNLEALVVRYRHHDIHLINTTSFFQLNFAHNAPLTRLRLEWPFPNSINFSQISATLTKLHLFQVSPDLCMQALVTCTELVELYCYEPSEPGPHVTVPLLSHPVVLRKLEYLEWPFQPRTESFNVNLLSFIEMPSLRTLSWVENSDLGPQPDHALVPGFIHRLPRTLERVEWKEITKDSIDQCNLVEYFPADTEIKSIKLHACSQEFLCCIMDRLSKEEDGSLPFPRLDYIYCRYIESELSEEMVEDLFETDISALLVDTLERRFNSNITKRFTFVLENVDLIHFDDTLIDRLEALQDKGLELEILRDGLSIFQRNDRNSLSDSDTSVITSDVGI